jgi:hypothetical protein
VRSSLHALRSVLTMLRGIITTPPGQYSRLVRR